jgi:hypothetical protein
MNKSIFHSLCGYNVRIDLNDVLLLDILHRIAECYLRPGVVDVTGKSFC